MFLENAPLSPHHLHYLPSKFWRILDQILPERFHVLYQSTLPPSLLPESSQVFVSGPKLMTKTVIRYKRQGNEGIDIPMAIQYTSE